MENNMQEANKVLEPVAQKILLEVSKEFNPQDFFKNGEGLYVWSSFTERILAKAEPTKAGTQFELSSFKLIKYSSDETIESNLPQNHIFTESEVCAVIAELISKQLKGEDGELLNTGDFNIFYTPTFVVGVNWDSDYRFWGVGTWLRGGGGWGSGGRVFSPATNL